MKNEKNTCRVNEVLRDMAVEAIRDYQLSHFRSVLNFLVNIPVHKNWKQELYSLIITGSRSFGVPFEEGVHIATVTWFENLPLDGFSGREYDNIHLARRRSPTSVGHYLVYAITHAADAEQALFLLEVIGRAGKAVCVGVTAAELLSCIRNAHRLKDSSGDIRVINAVCVLNNSIVETADALGLTVEHVTEVVGSGLGLRHAA